MRAIIGGIVLFIFLAVQFVHFRLLQIGGLPYPTVKAVYLFDFAFYVLYLLIVFNQIRSYYENQFIQAGIASMFVFFVIAGFTNFGLLTDPYKIMLWFIGANIVTTTIILISGTRHGILKD